MLNDSIEKVKEFVVNYKSDLYIAALIFLVGMASFGLGRLSILWPKKELITIENHRDTSGENTPATPVVALSLKGKYVASKAGKYYHLPWCAGAARIKESNKLWFDTKEAAEQKGYKPAGNCDGL